MVRRLIKNKHITRLLADDRKKHLTYLSARHVSDLLIKIVDGEKVIPEDSHELLIGEPESVFHAIITECKIPIEFLVHLRIVDEIDSFSTIQGSFERLDLLEKCLDESGFPASVIAHDPDPLTTLDRDFSDEKKWFGPTDKTVLRIENFVA